MAINEEEFEKAYELWESFTEELLYKNRFLVKHEVLNHLEQIANKSQIIVEAGTTLYRARIYNGDESFLYYLNKLTSVDDISQKLMWVKHLSERQNSGFWGYNSEDSFIPPSNDFVTDGRVNPVFIKYLYTAEDPYTALVEVRPYLKSKVSVAEIQVNESLKIADFSYDSIGNVEGFERKLIFMIMHDFSMPSNSDQKKYIPTQYVTEFFKSLGFEGIKFNSSLHGRGRNITIFNYEKCKPVASKLYEVEDICFEAKAIAPKFNKALAHWKLEPHIEKQREEILRTLLLKNKE